MKGKFPRLLRSLRNLRNKLFEKKRPKHEPTDSYVHLARKIVKCMMRYDKLNWYDHGGYKEMTAPYSNVNVTNEIKSKHSMSTKIYRRIVPQKEKLCFTKEDESECTNEKQKDSKRLHTM